MHAVPTTGDSSSAHHQYRTSARRESQDDTDESGRQENGLRIRKARQTYGNAARHFVPRGRGRARSRISASQKGAPPARTLNTRGWDIAGLSFRGGSRRRGRVLQQVEPRACRAPLAEWSTAVRVRRHAAGSRCVDGDIDSGQARTSGVEARARPATFERAAGRAGRDDSGGGEASAADTAGGP